MAKRFARYLLPNEETWIHAQQHFYNNLDGNIFMLLKEYHDALYRYYECSDRDDYRFSSVDKIAVMLLNSGSLETSDDGQSIAFNFPDKNQFYECNQDELNTGNVGVCFKFKSDTFVTGCASELYMEVNLYDAMTDPAFAALIHESSASLWRVIDSIKGAIAAISEACK